MGVLFSDSIKKGKVGEIIFREDFLDFLGVNYKDVSGAQAFQVIDIDYLTQVGKYEIKSNYKDDEHLIIEDYTNCNEKLAPISKGWFYKSEADLIVSVSKSTRTMILLPFTDAFKMFFLEKMSVLNTFGHRKLNKKSYSQYNGREWQSSYYKVPFDYLKGWISVYKRI